MFHASQHLTTFSNNEGAKTILPFNITALRSRVNEVAMETLEKRNLIPNQKYKSREDFFEIMVFWTENLTVAGRTL